MHMICATTRASIESDNLQYTRLPDVRPTQRSARLREISLLEINKHVGLYVLEGEYGIFYFILGELHSWD